MYSIITQVVVPPYEHFQISPPLKSHKLYGYVDGTIDAPSKIIQG